MPWFKHISITSDSSVITALSWGWPCGSLEGPLLADQKNGSALLGDPRPETKGQCFPSWGLYLNPPLHFVLLHLDGDLFYLRAGQAFIV